MNLTDLPLDVIEYISLYLSNETLYLSNGPMYQLSLSCRAFYNHFLPKFYKNVRLNDVKSFMCPEPLLPVSTEFVNAFKSRPYLGQYIKEVFDNPLEIHLLDESL